MIQSKLVGALCALGGFPLWMGVCAAQDAVPAAPGSESAAAETPAPAPVSTAKADGETGATDDTTVSRNRKEDASADRGFFNSHAETLRQGDIAVNSYELLFLGVSGGITDSLELSLTSLLPVVSEMPTVLLFQGKYAFFRNDRTTISARGNFSYFGETVDTGEGNHTAHALLFGAGVAIDHFVDEGGKFALHAALAAQGVSGDVDGDLSLGSGALISMEAGLTGRVSKRLKLLVDVLLPAAYSHSKLSIAEAALFTYGVRFHGEDLAADLGFMRPIGNVDTGSLVMGIPWVAFSARF